jgi:hypothetical protein
VKLKISELLNSTAILDKLMSEQFDDGLIAYKLARNIKLIDNELIHYEAARKALLEKHGEKNKDNKLEVPVPKRDEFTKQLNEILAQEIDINILTINPEKLSCHSPLEFLSIEWMLEMNEK